MLYLISQRRLYDSIKLPSTISQRSFILREVPFDQGQCLHTAKVDNLKREHAPVMIASSCVCLSTQVSTGKDGIVEICYWSLDS